MVSSDTFGFSHRSSGRRMREVCRGEPISVESANISAIHKTTGNQDGSQDGIGSRDAGRGRRPAEWESTSGFTPHFTSPAPPASTRRNGSILVELAADEHLDLDNSPSRIVTLGVQEQFAARAGCEHHQAHDAFAIDLLAIFLDENVAIKAIGSLDEH